jgi:DNA-binding NarL/FixJ family response regulator
MQMGLALLAHGLTHREIAEGHSTQFLGKLGLRSRAEAAACAVGGGTSAVP